MCPLVHVSASTRALPACKGNLQVKCHVVRQECLANLLLFDKLEATLQQRLVAEMYERKVLVRPACLLCCHCLMYWLRLWCGVASLPAL